MTRVGRLAIPFGILVVVLVVAAIIWNSVEDPHEREGHLVLYGNVDVRQVNLAFKSPGRIGSMIAEEGDTVTSGQIVASLEKADIADEVRLAQARVAAQSAQLAALETGTRPAEIEQARALVAQQQAAYRLARNSAERISAVAAQGFASRQALDEAQSRLGQAQAQLNAANEFLELALLGPRAESITQSRAQLEAEQAGLNLMRRRQVEADLLAPRAGTILTRVREPGAVVAAGETVYTLSLRSPVWVRTYVEEPDLGRIRAGMPAEVRTDSGGVYRGRVGFISPTAEFTPRTVETRELRTDLVYRLRIVVDRPGAGLRQGMPVTVILAPAPAS